MTPQSIVALAHALNANLRKEELLYEKIPKVARAKDLAGQAHTFDSFGENWVVWYLKPEQKLFIQKRAAFIKGKRENSCYAQNWTDMGAWKGKPRQDISKLLKAFYKSLGEAQTAPVV